MENVSDSIGWPTADRAWITKVLLMGLISLIPVYGWIVLTGWTLACLDNLRAGNRELARVGLGIAYVRRGIRLFAVVLVYSIAVGAISGLLIGTGSVLTSTGNRTDNPLTSLVGVLLMIVGASLAALGLLAIYLAGPPIVVVTDGAGIGAGLNPARVFRVIRSEPQRAIIAGLMAVIASVIGSLGAVLCGLGSILTIAYGQAVFAAVVHWFEGAQLEAPA